MKKEWIIGILGLWLMVLAFSGFPSSIQRILMIITGLAITFICFWKGMSERVREQIQDKNEDEQTPSA
jgi:uncharacterized membrane protein YuzA (DUF378 family)